jgi:D-glycero-D-manno-heptose 1,7-bisphosphate phosphatase
MKEDDLNRMHETVFNDVPIDGIYFCPHTYEEGCECRKPKPGLVLKGMREHNLEPENCWVMGDNDIDIVCGNEAKCKTILIGNEGIQKLEMHPDFLARNISDAVKIIAER